jgi:hypothetical protein
MINGKTRFRPVTGTEAQIEGTQKNPGYVYFASDTGKIFVDLDNEHRIAMGGAGVSVLYGEAPKGLSPDEYGGYTLSFDDLEEDVLPKEGDLILNTTDGVFYRVTRVDTDERTMYCAILAVSGSGGGGGGGASSLANAIGLKLESLATSNLINGQTCYVTYTATSATESDGSIMDDRLTITWVLSEEVGDAQIDYQRGVIDVNSGVTSQFEFGTKLRENASSVLTMYASGLNSGDSKKRQVRVKTSELRLTESANFSTLTYYRPENVTLQCNAIGDMDKILKFYWDGELLDKPRHLTANDANYQELKVPIAKATHGSHSVRIELYQGIQNGSDISEGLPVEPIEFEIAVVETGNTTPVVWLGKYQSTYYNYDNIQIPFLVYNPGSTDEAKVDLKKNGVPIPSSPRTIDTTTLKWNYFEITDAEMGLINRYSIGCGDTERVFTFNVVKDPTRTMEYMKKDNLKLEFNAMGRSNSESAVNREIWTTPDGKIKAEFSNFNWYNNGWIPDDKNQTCLRISNGAQFKIPYGKMIFNGIDASIQSNSIEIQFKVRNIQDYSNLIKNTTRYKDDSKFYTAFTSQSVYNNYDAFLQYYIPIWNETQPEASRTSYDDLKFDYVQKDVSLSKAVCKYLSGSASAPVGFCLGPQDAFFSNGTNTVSVNYIENDMIYLTMVYSYTSKLMYIYINGVITGVIKSTVDDFTIESNDIIFNSDYCDIDLYKIRIYNTDLNVNDVVVNHAVDKKDVLIYDQNKLAEENTAINEYQFKYENMIKYNDAHPNAPLMPYIVFDTSTKVSPHGDILPWSKKIEIPIKIEFVNTPLEAAYVSGELEALAIKDGLCTANSTPEQKAAAVKLYYKHHCPSWTGDYCEFVVQGTSSEFYPRRNYKIKLKTNYHKDATGNSSKLIHCLLNRGPYQQEYLQDMADLESGAIKYGEERTRQSGWYMDNYTNATDRWTMKVDYMESSGTYNAGFASMAATAYSKHPIEDYINAGAFHIENSPAMANPNPDPVKQKEAIVKEVKDALASPVTGKFDIGDFRTSLLGYPVLAFHKKSDGSYLYVGMYRMLLDKGSDDVLGFNLPSNILGSFVGDKKMKKKAECWEFCNNARGFCSYRDPWKRVELSFKAPEGTPEKEALTSDGAPIIADNIEYRYNDEEDWIDIVLGINGVTKEKSDEFVAEGPGFEIMSTSGKEKAREWLLGVYGNWEKVNKWVWSTNTDNVVSEGTYDVIDLFEDIYAPAKFFIEKTSTSEGEDGETITTITYQLEEESATYDAEKAYYKQITVDDKASYVPVLVTDNADLVYAAGKYYIMINGSYTPANDDFDSAATYYKLTVNEESVTATQADRLVAPVAADAPYDAEKEYYTYNGQTVIKKVGDIESLATRKLEIDSAEAYAAALETHGTLYYGISKAYGDKVYKYDTKEYRADKFINELNDHFDPEYLAAYFILTEVFECYDSRGKNCMMASWGPLVEGGDYVWYPIFYDIDTQLGINNTGIPSFEYNVDATEMGNYSTSDSLLWNNFYKYFKNSYILQKYKHLRGVTDRVQWTALKQPTLKSVEDIEKWYNFDEDATGMIVCRGVRPLIAKNLDMWWKYITITNEKGISTGITGWLDRNGKYDVDGNGTYFYALQGDRSQSRQQFLTSRIEYIDSWLNQGNYQRGGSNNIRGRVAANNATKTSDLWVNTDTTPYYNDKGEKNYLFDAEYWVNLKPIRSSYVTLSDDAEAYPSQKYDGITPVKFEVSAIKNGVMNSAGYPEQLLYIYGMNQMADLGEMHNLYWQEFDLTGDATHLTTLKLGTDELMEVTDQNLADRYDKNGGLIWEDSAGKKWFKWQNTRMNQPSIPANKTNIYGGMPLLKEVNLCNISVSTGSPVLDFSSCEKLQDFRATGSNFVQFKFAEGVALHTLYLPSTITSLELIEANLLTKVLKTYTPPKRNALKQLEAEPGLWLEGLFDGTDATSLHTLNFKGGSLGYGSYEFLSKLYDVRQRKPVTTKVQMTDVKWTPYTLLLEGDTYDKQHPELYFRDDGHMGLVAYTYDENAFEAQVLNGELYKLDKSLENTANQITSLAMFEDMANSDKWRGIAANSTVPNITGIVYINNTDAINEYEFRNNLAKKYPNLTFFFKNVTKAYTAKFIIQDETGVYKYAVDDKDNKAIQTITKDEWFLNPYANYTAIKENWDFWGWSTTNDKTGIIGSVEQTDEKNDMDWDTAKAIIFKEDVYDYTFYAVFTIHEWVMTFKTDANTTLTTTNVVHGEALKEPNAVPALNEDSLSATERYRFLGWSQSPNNLIVTDEKSAALVQVNTIIAGADMEFYAVFIKESVYDATSDLSWFDFTEEYWTHPLTSTTSEGYAVRPKLGRVLSGKITLPTTYNNKPVIICGGFSGHKITHLFWKGESKLLTLETQCFGSVSTLLYVDMPTTIQAIGESAFSSCNSLELPDLTKCPALDYIADYAFNGAGYHPTGGITLNIPGTVKHVGFGAFSFMRRIGSGGMILAQVNLGSATSPSQLVSIGLGKNFEANTGRSHGNFTAYGITNESLKNDITTYWLGKFTGTTSWL